MNTLTTRLARTESEWAAVAHIINDRFTEAFKVRVSTASTHMIACSNIDVVATIGMETSQHGVLPLEQFLTITDNRLRDCERERITEFTRWASTSAHAGAYAVLGAAAHVFEMGNSHIIFSMQEKQLLYLRRLRLPFVVLKSECAKEIPDALKPYYHAKTPPQVIMAETLDVWRVFKRATQTPVAA